MTAADRQSRFLSLLQAHQGLVRRVAAIYARDREDREDLFQEIAFQLWRSFESFQGESALSTFVYRVALNTALIRVRGAGRRPPIEAGIPVEDVESKSVAGSDEDVERLYAAIRELPPLDRAIVLLVLDEQSYEQIAAVTGLTVGNVGVRLSRSRTRLRARLRSMGAREEGNPCSTKT